MSIFGPGGVAIAGHHVSYGLLAVLLSVPVAGLAIYQFRSGAIGGGASSGSGAPSVDANGNILDSNGNPIGGSSVVGGGGGGGGGASDAALQNLGQQISALAQLFGSTQPYPGQGYAAQPAISYPTNNYYGTKAADVPAPSGSSTFQPTSSTPAPSPASGGFSPVVPRIQSQIQNAFNIVAAPTNPLVGTTYSGRATGGAFIP
jgi:hypothetical protein